VLEDGFPPARERRDAWNDVLLGMMYCWHDVLPGRACYWNDVLLGKDVMLGITTKFGV